MANSNGFIKMAVGALVVIIVAVSVILPLMATAEQTHATLTNDGYFRMSYYDTSDDHTVVWDHTKPNVVTVDSTDIEIGFRNINSSCTIVVDTSWILRYYTDGSGDGRAFGMYTFSTAPFVAATTTDATDANITLSGGTMTATFGAQTRTGTYTDLYLPDLDGDFIMKNAAIPAYVKSDSAFAAYGITRVNTDSSTYDAGLSFTGNVDALTSTVWRGTDNVTLSDVEVNTTVNSDYVDVYNLESITAVATYTETVDDQTVTTDTDVLYTYLIVPYEVTAELANHPDGVELTIIQILPVLVLVGVLMMIVTAFISNRRA